MESMLYCEVHKGRLVDPVSFMCGHSFCMNCVSAWAKFLEIRCPTCGKCHKLPKGRDDLTVNIALDNILKMQNLNVN